MKSIAQLLGDYQELFPFYSEYEKYFYEDLTDEHRLFLNCLMKIENNNTCVSHHYSGRGRPTKNRAFIFRAFIAKAIFRIPTVKDLISRLKSDRNLKRICGYSYEDMIPSESTFSRAFFAYAESQIVSFFHDNMIKTHLSTELIGHISRDSTAIKSRETPINTKKNVEKKTKRKRGRPRKGVIVEKIPSNIEKQINQPSKESLSALNQKTAWGVKKNSQGKVNAWKGYKLHLDVTDVGIPVTAILTGANVHDSQLAIPMEKITETKCTFLYSLMDAAYDARLIHLFIKDRGRVPIIDENKRRKDKIGFDPAKKVRYKIRSTVERCNSHLKDWLFGQAIFVKGRDKVMSHLMFGILVLTAMKIIQYKY